MIVGLGIIWVYLRRYRARRPAGRPATDAANPPVADAPRDARAARIARIEEELKGHRS